MTPGSYYRACYSPLKSQRAYLRIATGALIHKIVENPQHQDSHVQSVWTFRLGGFVLVHHSRENLSYIRTIATSLVCFAEIPISCISWVNTVLWEVCSIDLLIMPLSSVRYFDLCIFWHLFLCKFCFLWFLCLLSSQPWAVQPHRQWEGINRDASISVTLCRSQSL